MADWSRSRLSENVEVRSPYDPRDYPIRAIGAVIDALGYGMKGTAVPSLNQMLDAAEQAAKTRSLRDLADVAMNPYVETDPRINPVSKDPFMAEMTGRLSGIAPGEENVDPISGAIMASSPTPAASRTASASNPLADRGWSNEEYAAAVGTLAGEVAVNGNLRDYQAVADVIANRLDSKEFAKYGGVIGQTVARPNEFSTWSKSPKTIEAYRTAVTAFNAAMNPKLEAKLPAALQERVSLAKQAVDDVFNTQVARGVAKGATYYDNPTVTHANRTAGWHDGLENQYGSAIIGDHRFTGPDFNPDAPDVDVDANRVQRGVGMPDLPGALGGFDLNSPDFSLPSVPDVPDPMRSLTPEGMIAPGNINLAERPAVLNDDGTISTVRSMSINVDGREVLIPTVALDGSRILSEQEAIQQFQQTGQHLGVFDTPEAATAYAEGLHQDQEALYADRGLAPPDLPGPLSGLNAPDYSDITASLYGDYNAPPVPDVFPADWTIDKPLSASLAGLGLENQRPSTNLETRRNYAAEIDPARFGNIDGEWGLLSTAPASYERPATEAPVDYGETYSDMSEGLYPSYGDITAGIPGFDPAASRPTESTIEGTPVSDILGALYGNAEVPSPPDVGGLYGLDSYGPAMSEAGWSAPSHTGFGGGSFQTPDFDAPTQQARDRIANFEARNFVGLGAPDFEGMARDLTAEITGKPSFDTVSTPERYTAMETRTREVPFSAPNSLQAAVMGDWEDKFGPAKPAMASKPQTRIETYQQPVEKTRMVQHQVPVAPRALPSQEMAQEAINDQHPRATPSGLGATFGSFDNFLGAMNAHDPRAMGAINSAGMGYAANYAMGDGPYATMGTNDLQDKFGSQFGMDARKGLSEGFKQDYGQLSPTARGGIEGAMKGLAMGGPLGMLGGGALGALSGYAMPNGIMGTLGSLFDGTFGGGIEMGLAGNMSNYGTPYDGAGIATSHDVNFDRGSREAAMRAEAEALQNGTFGGGPPSYDGGGWGNDPSQDGGSRYSGW